jgi:hypothetical protein
MSDDRPASAAGRDAAANPAAAPRRAALLARRAALAERAAALRADFGRDAEVLRGPLTLVDRTRAGIRWLAHRPALPLAAGVAGWVLKRLVRRGIGRRSLAGVALPTPRHRGRGRLGRWIAGAWWVWRLVRSGRRWIGRLPKRRVSR